MTVRDRFHLCVGLARTLGAAPVAFGLLCGLAGEARAAPGSRSEGTAEFAKPPPERVSNVHGTVTADPENGLRISAPLGEHRVYFHPGLSYWLRGQSHFARNFDYDDARNDHRLLHQLRLLLEGGWGPLRVLGQFQDARVWGNELSTHSNNPSVFVHQAFLEVRGESDDADLEGFVRAGRQEIKMGTLRLFAQRPWNVHGQAFNGLRIGGRYRKVSADTFAALLARPQTFEVDDGATVTRYTTPGGWVGMGVLSAGIIDAFAVDAMLAWTREDVKPDDLTLQRMIWSPGLRLRGRPVRGLEYDVEGYVQAGEDRQRTHLAWAAAGTLSYTFAAKVEPRILAGYSIASGQACTGDPMIDEACDPGAERNSEFFDFYRRRHGYQGIADLAQWRNVRDLELQADVRPLKSLRLNFQYHYFQLHETTGRWWRVPDTLVGSGWDPENTDHNLGHEVDLVLRWQPWSPFEMQVGYSIFAPVGAGKAIGGGSDPLHFAYVRTGLRF